MVNSEVSGVAFSRHPLKPLSSDAVLVEAVYGLGEGLVSGELEADRYEVRSLSISPSHQPPELYTAPGYRVREYINFITYFFQVRRRGSEKAKVRLGSGGGGGRGRGRWWEREIGEAWGSKSEGRKVGGRGGGVRGKQK